MQINSISPQKVSQQSFGNKQIMPMDLRDFAYLDDKTVRKMAISTASEKVNDKKHKRISNAIIYSIPLAAGLAAAIKNPASRIGRLGAFAKNAGAWLTGFALIDGALAAKHKIEKKMPKVQKFNSEHPIVTFIGSMATAAVALFGGSKLLGKVYNKFLAKQGNNILNRLQPSIAKLSNKLNSNKLINNIATIAKTAPAGVKTVAKGIINNGIWILAGSSLVHSISHERAKNKECVSNYIGIKNAQAQVRNKLEQMDAALAEQV